MIARTSFLTWALPAGALPCVSGAQARTHTLSLDELRRQLDTAITEET